MVKITVSINGCGMWNLFTDIYDISEKIHISQKIAFEIIIILFYLQ